MRYIFTITAFFIMLGTSFANGLVAKPATMEIDPARLTAIDRHFEQAVANGDRAGYSLLIARDGQIVHEAAIGWSSLEVRSTMSTRTRFRLASMTKPITSVAIMMLVERGRLRLSDPVSRYIPAFASPRISTGRRNPDGQLETVDARREITLLDLMTHTSGLGGGANLNEVMADEYAELARTYFTVGDLEQKSALLASTPLWFQPGTQFGYGIYSTDVLGRVIEIVSNLPLEEFLNREIFTPLDMHDTGFLERGRDIPELATIYTYAFGTLTPSLEHPLDQLSAPHGGGGLYSTPRDYYRFLQMLENDGAYGPQRLLSPTTVGWMTRNALPASLLPLGEAVTTFTGGFGLGFGVTMDNFPIGHSPLSDGDYYWGGSTDTFFFVSPRHRTIAIIMSQMDILSRPRWDTWGDFAAMVMAAFVTAEPVAKLEHSLDLETNELP